MGRIWPRVLVGLCCCALSSGARAEQPDETQAEARHPPPALTAAAPFRLALHARSTNASARSERAAWLTLTLPLDSLAAPRAAQAAVAPVSPVEPPVEPSASPNPPLLLHQLRALSTFARRAKAVAMSVVGAARERQRLDSLSTRARASAALPEVRLRAQRSTDQALRWAPTADDPYRVTQADGAGTTLEASLTFQLDRLLFSREELAIERLRSDSAAERLKLEARVQSALWGVLRAQLLACAPGVDEEERAEQLARLAEHFGVVDDLTAGWFSAHAESFSQAVWGFPEAISGSCAPPSPEPAPGSTKAVASLEDSE